MTIDSADILTTYGLKLMKIEGWESLPGRKKILNQQQFTSSDIKRQSREVTLKFWGGYASTALLGSKITAFKTWLTGSITRYYEIEDMGIAFTGAAPDGMRVTGRRKIALVELPVTVIEGGS